MPTTTRGCDYVQLHQKGCNVRSLCLAKLLELNELVVRPAMREQLIVRARFEHCTVLNEVAAGGG
jgi:hypothetical protein